MRSDLSPDGFAVPDPTAVAEGELAKSGTTRRRILESARDLLVTAGYAGFSTAAVAEGAGLTRPAMLYHFGSRQELLTATIQFLAHRRIDLFHNAIAKAYARHGDDRIAIRLEVIDIALAQIQQPEYIAFQELISASRTDPELAAVVAPAAAYYDAMRRRATFKALPRDKIAPDDFQLVRDVVQFVTEGAGRPHAFTFDGERRMRTLREFLRQMVAHQWGGEFAAMVTATLAAEDLSARSGGSPNPPSD